MLDIFKDRTEIHADCEWVGKPVEMFKIEEQKGRFLEASDDYISTVRGALDETYGWLPFASEKYNISADLNDYVMVPVTIFLSGIPNKKGHCFTYQELTSFDPSLGCLKYKTWEKKPLHIDHKNKDYTIAKGVVLSASLQPAPSLQGDLYKLICLQAFCRKTSPDLTNKILTGECHSYSMGATCKSFNCSVCSASVPEDRCGHIPMGMLKGDGFKYTKVGEKLAYVEAQDILGFEVSALPTRNNPANIASHNKLSEILRWNG